MAMKFFFILALGVVILGAAMAEESHQFENAHENEEPITSQGNLGSNEPMTSQENGAGMRPLATPEVVLQLKYDGGELNRIYLTQFRKGKTSWVPSVPDRIDLCTDLCHAGLGGKSCGESCSDMIPVGLQSALEESANVSVTYGQPRVDVCPTLCNYGLGRPLCGCNTNSIAAETDWSTICHAFCAAGGYVLRGCPKCDDVSSPVLAMFATRILNTEEGWSSWCNVQCIQGHGGAACNCDRSPFL